MCYSYYCWCASIYRQLNNDAGSSPRKAIRYIPHSNGKSLLLLLLLWQPPPLSLEARSLRSTFPTLARHCSTSLQVSTPCSFCPLSMRCSIVSHSCANLPSEMSWAAALVSLSGSSLPWEECPRFSEKKSRSIHSTSGPPISDSSSTTMKTGNQRGIRYCYSTRQCWLPT